MGPGSVRARLAALERFTGGAACPNAVARREVITIGEHDPWPPGCELCGEYHSVVIRETVVYSREHLEQLRRQYGDDFGVPPGGPVREGVDP
jgi:hypothetical protein